ncbi:MAG: DUF4153 domain-containing protein [Propylenella sp.]
MRGWFKRQRDVRGALVAAFGRFPVAVLALAILAAVVNIEIAEFATISEYVLFRSVLASVGAAAIAVAAVLLCESRGFDAPRRHALSLVLAAAVGAALWYWRELAVTFPTVLLAAFLAIPLAPFVRWATGGFWTFVWRAAHASALALIAVVVFCLGLSAIFASIDYLFGVGIDDSLYGHVWATGLGFAGPVFALSLFPTHFPERDDADPANIFVAGARLLSDFVVAPLVAAYAVILHVYALKILAEGELPKGQIGWMVLTFGLAVLAVRVVVGPLAGLVRAPTRLFLRFWAAGLVVPLALLVVAVWERIDAYGVTPERYALGLFALFLALVLISQVWPRWRSDERVIPVLAVLALVAASFGPWSMLPVSGRSQVDRLMSQLADAGALSDGALVTRPEFARDAAEDVRSKLQLLDEIGQIYRLRPLFARLPDNPISSERDVTDESEISGVRQALNVETLPPLPEEVGNFAISSNLAGAVVIAAYDVIVPNLFFASSQEATATLDGVALQVRCDGSSIEIASEGTVLRITQALLRGPFKERIDKIETLPESTRPPFLVELTLDRKRVALLFRSVSGKLTEQQLSLLTASYDLLLRRSDWVR